MKSNGTKYVLAVLALLASYFVYVWWFSPTRLIKRQLGRLAATLSVPANEADIARIARLAQLRRYLAEDVHLTVGRGEIDIASRDVLLAAVAARRAPPGGADMQFVDVQVTVDSNDTARAFMTVEVRSEDARSGERSLDSRDVRVALAQRNGEWVITTAESPQPLTHP